MVKQNDWTKMRKSLDRYFRRSERLKVLGTVVLVLVVVQFGFLRPSSNAKFQAKATFRTTEDHGFVLKDGFPHLMSIADVSEHPSCEELVKVYMDRIDTYDAGNTQAVVELRKRDQVLKEARALDETKKKKKKRLHCVPIMVKDNIAVKDTVNAAGSIVLRSMIPLSDRDAKVVKALKAEGAIILGRANMDEFALGFRSLSSRGGQTRNPFDLSRFPGGSSGGTAVSVASGFAVIGIGTDTGGSVRIPASFSGLVGLRPTVGTISVDQVVPLSHSRDTVGVMASTVHDARIAFEVSAGTVCASSPKTKKLRVGVMDFMLPLNGKLRKAIESQIKRLSNSMMEFVRVDTSFAIYQHYTSLSKFKSTSSFEFQSDLDQYFGGKVTLPQIVSQMDLTCSSPSSLSKISPDECKLILGALKKKLWKGNKLSKKDQQLYQKLLGPFSSELEQAANNLLAEENLDFLVYPTFSKLPSKRSKGKQEFCGNNRLAPALKWPAVTLPITFTDQGLPIGLEILGPAHSECKLFDIAETIENTLALNRKRLPFLQYE